MRLESGGPETTVLVETRVLAGLERVVGAMQVRGLVWEGIETYARYCHAMTPRGGESAQAAHAVAHAHKLKGSAGTLGLRAIAEVAGRIEDMLESGDDGVDLIRELQRTIEATRQELLALGMVPPAVNS